MSVPVDEMLEELRKKMEEITSEECQLSMALDDLYKEGSDENIGAVQMCLSTLANLYQEAEEITIV